MPTFKSEYQDNLKTCADAETYFAKAIRDNAFSKDKYFIYKNTGAETALSRVPMNIDGCIIPPGTLCHVARDNDKIISVQPLRLTMFSVPEETAKHLYKSHYDRAIISNGIQEQDLRSVYREIAPESEKKSLADRVKNLFSNLFSSAE